MKDEKIQDILEREIKKFHEKNPTVPKSLPKIETRSNLSYFMDTWRKKRIEDKKKEIELKKVISDLKFTNKVSLNEMISDLRLFKPTFWNRMRGKFFPIDVCMAIIHYPQSVDVVRYYPMPKPFVLDINHKLYLFTPKAFRSMNGIQKLEFYANIPFAVIHNVGDKYIPPSLDADAFSAVQKSKFIQDAASIAQPDNISGIMIAIIIVCALAFVMGIINLTYLLQIIKALKGLG